MSAPPVDGCKRVYGPSEGQTEVDRVGNAQSCPGGQSRPAQMLEGQSWLLYDSAGGVDAALWSSDEDKPRLNEAGVFTCSPPRPTTGSTGTV